MSPAARSPAPPPPPPRSVALQAWDRADAALGGGQPIDAVAAALPDRQGWLLRGLSALEHGSADDLAQLAEAARQAGHADIALVLDVAAAPPADIDPSRVRQKAKRAGIENLPQLPALDLLRALAAFVSGEPGTGSPALRRLKNQRPALNATYTLLTSRSRTATSFPITNRYLPRAGQVALAGGLLRRRYTDPARYLDGADGKATVRVDEILSEGGLKLDADLVACLSGQRPWPPANSRGSTALLDAVSDKDKPAVLSLLVRTLQRRVAEGRYRRLTDMATSAARLATDQGDLGLATQLVLLAAVLDSADAPTSPPWSLLNALWRVRHQHLRPEEITLLAQALVCPSPLDEEGPYFLQAATWLVAHEPEAAPTLGLILGLLQGAPVPEVVHLLDTHGASEARILLTKATMLGMRGDDAELLAMIPRLVELGEMDGAARCLALCAPDFAGGRRLARGAERAGRAAVRRGSECGALLTLLIPLMRDIPDDILAAAEWVLTDERSPAQVGPLIALAVRLGRADLATDRVRQEGRRLRQERTPRAAEDHAMALIRSVVDVNAPPVDDPIFEVLRPLSSFVLREGPARALAVNQRLGMGPRDLAGVAPWYLHHQDQLEAQPGWREAIVGLIAASMADPPGSPAARMSTAPGDSPFGEDLPPEVNRILIGMTQRALDQHPKSLADLVDRLSPPDLDEEPGALLSGLMEMLGSSFFEPSGDDDDPIPF